MKRAKTRSSEKKTTGHKRLSGKSLCFRSKLTNGSALLEHVDRRSAWARRLRDLIEIHVADLGGEANISQAELTLIKRAACLTTELEFLESKFAINGGGKGYQLDRYQRMVNTLRRTLESLGLRRRMRDITPDPLDYAKQIEGTAA